MTIYKLNYETRGWQFINLTVKNTIQPKRDCEEGLDPGQHQGHLLLHLQGPQLDGVELPL